MTNTNTLNGFRPVGTITGAPYNGAAIRMYKAAGTTVTNDMFVGDLVTFSGTGDASGVPGVSVATAGAANAVLGCVVGVEADPAHLDRATWIDGADAGYVMVCVDPNVVYEAQAGGAVPITSIGENVNMEQSAAGSRTAGTSGQHVLNTVASSLSTWQLKIVGLPQRADNEVNAAYNKVLVIINNHVLKGHTGTAGI